MPDVRSCRFVHQAHRQSLRVANRVLERDDQTFVDVFIAKSPLMTTVRERPGTPETPVLAS